VSPAYSLNYVGSLNYDDADGGERVHYLQNIVKHYVPNLSLDLNSLREASGNLPTKRHEDSGSEAALSAQEELDILGDLALDDEYFTIQTGPNNTTRRLLHPRRINPGSCFADGLPQNIQANFLI
jgi:hypothetical protein